jgi:hypothetical protein
MRTDQAIKSGLVIAGLALALCPAGCDSDPTPQVDAQGQAQDSSAGKADASADVGVSPDAPGAADSAPLADVQGPAPDANSSCAKNAECSATRYCSFASGCGKTTGTCKPRPASCSGPFQPVCGCDHTSYDNACKAAKAGQSIKYQGMCGCKNNCDCPQSQGCDPPTGNCVIGIVPAYCCTKPGCLKGEACTNPDGSSGTCP